MIEKWELSHFPSDKDPRRFKARIKASEQDLKNLLAQMPVPCGKPFVTLSQDFNWAFYLNGVDASGLEQVQGVLRGACPRGTYVESPALELEKELPPMLEDILETAARNLSGTAGPEPSAPPFPPPPAPPEEPPAAAVKRDPVPPSSRAASEGPTAGKKPEAPPGPAAPTALDPLFIFSEFVVGPNNRFTHAAAQAVADNPGKIYNPFFIYGEKGLGKTHLMQAIGHEVLSRHPQARIACISGESLEREIAQAARQGAGPALRERYRELDLLLLDDIHSFSGAAGAQEELFHVFNGLHEQGKQILLTSALPPRMLSALEDRLRSRFEWGLIADLKAPSLETRIAILKKKSALGGLSLPDDYCRAIAEQAGSNVRDLVEILKWILARTQAAQALPSVEEVLSRSAGAPVPPRKPSAPEKAAAAPPAAPSRIETPAKMPPPQPPSPPAAAPAQIPRPAAAAPEPPPVPAPRAPEAPVPPPAPPPVPEERSGPPATGSAPEAPAAPPPLPPEDADPSLRAVDAACFYPAGKEAEYRETLLKFSAILKKHKLKFRLHRLADKPFECEKAVDYSFFARECQAAGGSIAFVLGPPASLLSEDDFASALGAALEEHKIALQIIPWSEMTKDYRFLNCALDLSLLVPPVEPAKK